MSLEDYIKKIPVIGNAYYRGKSEFYLFSILHYQKESVPKLIIRNVAKKGSETACDCFKTAYSLAKNGTNSGQYCAWLDKMVENYDDNEIILRLNKAYREYQKNESVRLFIYDFMEGQYGIKEINDSLDFLDWFHKEVVDEMAINFSMILKYADGEVLMEAVEMYKKYADKDIGEVKKVVNHYLLDNAPRDKIAKVVKILDKYNDNQHEIVVEKLWNIGGYLDELLSDEAYNAIKKNPSVIHRLEDYIANRLMVDIKVSYDELELITNTYNLMAEIHKERSYGYFNQIREGFFKELNRAINQETNYNKQIKNLRIYCREVQGKLLDNASDLMVVTDEA